MWITPDQIEVIYGVVISEEFIAHVQSLAEVCVGEIEDPSPQLEAVFIDVVYRKHLATTENPHGLNQETLGPYSYSISGAPGLGLTDRDCKSLKKAAGQTSLWVQPTTRGPVETPTERTETILE